MSGLKHAGSFRDLLVYQKSRQLQREILKLTKLFPKEEMFCGTPPHAIREESAEYFIESSYPSTDN